MIPEGNDLASYSVNIEEEHFILSLEDKEGNVDCFKFSPEDAEELAYAILFRLTIDHDDLASLDDLDGSEGEEE